MVKSTNRNERGTRYLVNLSRSRELVIQKRGRLLRTGEFIRVEKLDQFPGSGNEAWLRASIAIGSKVFSKMSKWDSAHALSRLIRDDLGRLVYVEPELNEGQTGLYRDLMKKFADVQADSKDEGEEDEQGFDSSEILQEFDPKSLVPNPASQFDQLMPGKEFLPDQNFGSNFSRRPSHQRDQISSAFDIQGELSSLGSTKTEAPERERFCFSLLYELENWNELDTIVRRMLEVEMAQVYRGAELRATYPNLETTEPPILSPEEQLEIFNKLLNQPMSNMLSRVIGKNI